MRDDGAITAIVESDSTSRALPPELPPAPHRRAPDPDDDLLRLVLRGDGKTALRLLMKRHGNAVYRYCRQALADAALADDVHQQIFIQAYRDLPTFQPRAAVRTWLFAIARHRVLDAAKSRRLEQARTSDDDLTDAPAPQPLPPSTLDDLQLRSALEASIARLSEPSRTAVLLRFRQGLTFEEIAATVGESAGTVQARVSRALAVLRRDLARRTGAPL